MASSVAKVTDVHVVKGWLNKPALN